VKAEITFDLVMEDDMSFAEGCYRFEDGIWRVFTCFKSGGHWPVGVRHCSWASGVTGVNIVAADDDRINRAFVFDKLSETFGVTEWREVRGPDSIQLR
jgi:hypothetical protein